MKNTAWRQPSEWSQRLEAYVGKMMCEKLGAGYKWHKLPKQYERSADLIIMKPDGSPEMLIEVKGRPSSTFQQRDEVFIGVHKLMHIRQLADHTGLPAYIFYGYKNGEVYSLDTSIKPDRMEMMQDGRSDSKMDFDPVWYWDKNHCVKQ